MFMNTENINYLNKLLTTESKHDFFNRMGEGGHTLQDSGTCYNNKMVILEQKERTNQ